MLHIVELEPRMDVQLRQAFEVAIVRAILRQALSLNYSISLCSSHDEPEVKESQNENELLSAFCAVDTCELLFFASDKLGSIGWCRLIAGESGHDIIQDWSGNSTMDLILLRANLLSARLSQAHHFIPSKAQIDCALDGYFYGEDWRKDLEGALEPIRLSIKRALIFAHYEL